MVQGGIAYPANPSLHRLAVEYCRENLAEEINLADYENVLTVCEVDADNQPVKCVGINARIVMYDFPVWRASTSEAMDELIVRTKSNLDEQGMRGRDVFVHVAQHEAPESRCPSWKKFLRKVRAEKASRWRVKV
jgi:hypothetical protein